MASNDIILKIRGDIQDLQGKLNQIHGDIQEMSTKSGKALETPGFQFVKLNNAVELTLRTVRMLDGALDSLVGEGVETEAAFSQVNTLLDISSAQFELLRDQARALSAEGAGPGTEIAKGLYDAISAGVELNGSIGFMRDAVKAAVAGGADTSTAVDLLTTTINAYGKSASDAGDVSDQLFTIVKRGKTTFPELAAQMGPAIATAAQYEVQLDDLGVAMAAATRKGINTARSATGVSGAIREIVTPGNKVEKVLRSIGYESGQAAIKQDGLVGVIQKLVDSGINIAAVFGQEAAPVIAAVGGDAKGVAQDMEAMANATGLTQSAFQKMSEDASFRLKKLKGVFETLRASVQNRIIPILSSAATTAADFFRSLTETSLEKTIRQLQELGAETLDLQLALARVRKAEAEEAAIGLKSEADIQRELNDLAQRHVETLEAKGKAQAELLESGTSEEELRRHIAQQENKIALAATGQFSVAKASLNLTVQEARERLKAIEHFKEQEQEQQKQMENLREQLLLVQRMVAAGESVKAIQDAITASKIETREVDQETTEESAKQELNYRGMRDNAIALRDALGEARDTYRDLTLEQQQYLTIAWQITDALGRSVGHADQLRENLKRVGDQIVTQVAKDILLYLVWLGVTGGTGGGINPAELGLSQLFRFFGTKASLPGFDEFAGGTTSAPGGLAVVGEQGPELVNLPKGSRVHTSKETREILGAKTDMSETNQLLRTLITEVRNQPVLNIDYNGFTRRFIKDYERITGARY